MRYFLLFMAVFVLVGCGRGPYDDLEDSFGAQPGLRTTPIQSRSVVMTSKRYKGAFNYQEMFTIRLSREVVEMVPSSSRMKTIRIPVGSVTACSARSFGGDNWWARLLLEEEQVDIDIKQAHEIIDWCWENRIPAASHAEGRAWMYRDGRLPSRSESRKELLSREAYDEQISQARLGY